MEPAVYLRCIFFHPAQQRVRFIEYIYEAIRGCYHVQCLIRVPSCPIGMSKSVYSSFI